MIIFAGFLGARINNRIQLINIHFRNEYLLTKIIDHPIPDLEKNRFFIVNF